MHIVIIIPTYNEKENIPRLIPEIESALTAIPDEVSILVVDDNSPDGTADAVKELMGRYGRVRMIGGEKEGLGRAYVRGMGYALDVMKADAVMEMDADFSHKPSDVPRIVEQLKGHDFVIGSRYVKGGKIPEGWPFFRKMNSRFGNICARYIADIAQVKDCTAGFRAIKAPILRRINLDRITVDGYCFQVTLLHHAMRSGALVKEIPVEFADRTAGISKLSLKDILEFIREVWMIRLYSARAFSRFAAVGVSGIFVNLGSLTILLQLGMNKFLASPASMGLSLLWNFYWNNAWTFGGTPVNATAPIRGLKFNAVSLFSVGSGYALFILILRAWPGCLPQIAQAAAIIPMAVLNYFLNVYWTFETREENI